MLRTLFIFLITLFSLQSLEAQTYSKPRRGEGVSTFLLRNKRNPNVYRDAFVRLNKRKLGRNNSLLYGVSYQIPPLIRPSKPGVTTRPPSLPRKGVEPLFGKRYQHYTVKSNVLQGATYYLCSGHGGPDPGAIGKYGKYKLYEDEYAYDVILRLGRALLERGATVHFIIRDPKDGIRSSRILNYSRNETCMGRPIPLSQLSRLKQRVVAINNLAKKSSSRYKRSVFLHVDSRSLSKRMDVFFYYNSKKGSREMVQRIRNTFEMKYKLHQPGRGFGGTVSTRSLYVMNNVAMPAAFVELGNIQNAFDQPRFMSPDNRQALANWMCDGFVADYVRYRGK